MEKPSRGIEFRQNHLPQWRQDCGTYFVTWRLHDDKDSLSPEERSIVADSIRYFHAQRYRLSGFVVMDNHVHVLMQTLPGQDLSRILLSIKTYSATPINRLRGVSGKRWQKDSYTELMRNPAAVQTRREYIYVNPIRKWRIEPKDYPWLEQFE